MSETLIFHSQLSSIMEKLVISAVSEINRLVSDYCAAVILKDQLKTRYHSVHQPAHEDNTHRNTAIGNEAALLAALTQSSAARCPPAPPAGWRHTKAVAATQTEEEPEEHGSVTPSDYKTEVGTVKNERLRGNKAAEKAQSCASPLVSQQQQHHHHPAELGMGGSPAEWQFHLPEESKEQHHPDDHHQPTEEQQRQQQLNIAACLDQLGDGDGDDDDVGILIKRETESIDLDPPSSLEDQDDPSLHLAFQLHPGAVGHQMYPGGDYDMLPDLSLLRRGGGGGGGGHHHHDASDEGIIFGHQQHQHHHQVQRSNSNNNNNDGAPFKVVCEFCGKGFAYQSELKRHAVTHTGERTQHCEQCGKSFIRRSHLLRHKLLHTGFRPFTCPICYRRFSRTSHLERHMKTHLC